MEKNENLSLKAMIVLRKAVKTIDNEVLVPIKQKDLSIVQFGILEILYSKGSMKIGELMERVLSTSGNMTVVIRNMEKKGWIQKSYCPHDKRAFLIEITDEGKKIIEDVLPKHIKSVGETFSILTDEDKENLIRIMKKFKK